MSKASSATPDPRFAVRKTLEGEPFDEVIVAMLPARVSHWLHRDLPSRVEQFGVSVKLLHHVLGLD
jgi:hypothetical protein